MEVTVRDGGYEVDHNWGLEDVATLVSVLDGAGFRYLEVGYGMGVGRHRFPPASQPSCPPWSATRSRCRRRCRSHRRDGDPVPALAVMPGDVGPATLAYIERAKSHGLIVSLNLMQTYAFAPAEVARIAADARRSGADWF